MEGRLFFVDKGTHMAIRNSDGITVSFESLEQFNRYYSGELELSGEYYIDYEPEKKLLYKSAKGNFEPLSNEWKGPVPGYEDVIDDVENIQAKLNDPYFGLNLEESRAFRLNELKRLTYAVITKHMPEWKQIKRNEYINLHQKVKNGDSLTGLEQEIYDHFPNGKETHESCYNNCLTAARWLMECKIKNDRKEKEIKKARGIKAVKAVKDPDYPEWEL
ncbi:MAG: hypothetical protein GY940_10055 [bacterium]|nr:hypothetical protein [bacterium]